MSGTIRFLLLVVGGTLVLASALLAFPGGPAYEKSFTHEATLDHVPKDDTNVTYYRNLPDREQALVERALDGETVLIPAHRDLPPAHVYHTDRSALYRFEKNRYYDVQRTEGKAGILAGVIGVSALTSAIWVERRR